MPPSDGDFPLSLDELRVVARYAVESAEPVLGLFESVHPDDRRPRAAVEAAWAFVRGAPRTRLQRDAASDAHRAASSADGDVATYAARAAGDAAAAAYLHPLRDGSQVGHILRAAACAARAAELAAGDDHDVGEAQLEQARQRATPVLIDVLRRYPPVPTGRSRLAQLMTTLDALLRATPTAP